MDSRTIVALALPIVLVESRFDSLSGWQATLFALVGLVLTTLMTMSVVRLVKSYRRVALPSA